MQWCVSVGWDTLGDFLLLCKSASIFSKETGKMHEVLSSVTVLIFQVSSVYVILHPPVPCVSCLSEMGKLYTYNRKVNCASRTELSAMYSAFNRLKERKP